MKLEKVFEVLKRNIGKKFFIKFGDKKYQVNEFNVDNGCFAVSSTRTYSKGELIQCDISFGDHDDNLSVLEVFDKIVDYTGSVANTISSDYKDEKFYIRFGLYSHFEFEVEESSNKIIFVATTEVEDI